MSRRSILISHMGSSLRSEPELEDRGSTSSHSYDLLTPLHPRDRSFDNVSEASGDLSVVSHPFSEEAPRFGESVAVGQFSSIHQEVMASLREQTRGDSCCSTCSSCDTCSTDTWEALGIDEARILRATPQPLPALVERQIVEKLGEVVLERKEKQERSVHSPGEESRTPRPHSRPHTAPDNMSGLWNMLATYDEFFVTPPGFNLYQQDKPHWLDQEPIPWEVREKARRKCVKWLNNYHN